MIGKRHAHAIRRMIEKASVSLSDGDALAAVELYPAWSANTEYTVNERIRHDEKLYRVIQAHTSQEGWTPNLVPALFTEVSIEEIPEWKQPLGSEDAYHIGDKVRHKEAVWISTVDNNVWEPSVYGWDEI